MTKEQKIVEKHKRAARRNFLIGSRDEQDKIKERYKPANLRGVIKLKTCDNAVAEDLPISRELKRQLSSLPDLTEEQREADTRRNDAKMTKKLEKARKELDYDLEVEFRAKIRKVANKLNHKEEANHKIFYTHMSQSRRMESVKDKPVNQLRNCRQYLDFMENYIHDLVKEHNKKMAANPQLYSKKEETAADQTAE